MWTDNLLWHHACHSVDLFLHHTQESLSTGHVVAGPLHRELGIPLDMAIQLRTVSGILASTSLSFNHEGEQGSAFRYICDEGSFVVEKDEITDANGIPVPALFEGFVSGLHAMDQNFVNAILGKEAPRAEVGRCLPAMRVLSTLEGKLHQCAS
jgi:2-hydroxy-4-carboxymuconate semialdehyde hemiacetal dehydrogenase